MLRAFLSFLYLFSLYSLRKGNFIESGFEGLFDFAVEETTKGSKRERKSITKESACLDVVLQLRLFLF